MKSSNNRILIIVLVVLLGGYALSRVFRSPGRERNVTTELLAVDTASVTELVISPMIEEGVTIKLVRDEGQWRAEKGNSSASTDAGAVRGALGAVTSISTDRVISRSRDRWNEYQVDSTGTHLVVRAGEAVLADLWIGKNIGGSVCVRKDGDDDVYATGNMLHVYFNKRYNDWRNKSFLKVAVDEVSRVTFDYPYDSSFVLEKNDQWQLHGATIDSVKVKTFLGRFRAKLLGTFADDFVPPGDPDLKVEFTRAGGDPTEVRAWKLDDDEWVVKSTQQPDAYFSVTRAQLINDLFVGQRNFMN